MTTDDPRPDTEPTAETPSIRLWIGDEIPTRFGDRDGLDWIAELTPAAARLLGLNSDGDTEEGTTWLHCLDQFLTPDPDLACISATAFLRDGSTVVHGIHYRADEAIAEVRELVVRADAPGPDPQTQ